MKDVDAVNFALLLLRCGVGAVMLAHGIRHIFGGGKIQGTAGWFASLGMKPGIVHAWLASLTEVGAGVSLVLGFLTPLGAAGVVGTMLVALVTNHFRNGFFIFYKGEGYEYVMTLVIAGLALSALGGGKWSVDHAIDLGWTHKTGLEIGFVGVLGALALLAVFWRRPPAADA
ncbi:MAG TPA: DoxX family protein [Acidimicrobiales bacterium]|nr:DoxX family protein [Acidimicrobiales bacterium]